MERVTPLVSGYQQAPVNHEAHSSGVSWTAVIAGAFVAAALSLSLLALGTGLGLSSVSPWANVGISAATATKTAILWLIVTQFIAMALGGYIAGRLRTKWATIHSDEVYFRDTAHGFLVWAVGVVITASFLATAALSMVGQPSPIATSSSEASAQENPNSPSAYFVDRLFRSETATAANDASVRAEASRILTHALGRGDVPADDKAYLTQLVASKTGLSQAEAEKRVSEVDADAQQAMDAARKSMAHLSIWIFIALLIGAFSGSFAATVGGRQRDSVKLI